MAETLLRRARVSARLVTVNAAPGSEAFGESLGLVGDACDGGHTHVLGRDDRSDPETEKREPHARRL